VIQASNANWRIWRTIFSEIDCNSIWKFLQLTRLLYPLGDQTSKSFLILD